MERYNKLNKYYKDKFGERVLKICVDAGFTCPNRDGTKSTGGCTFCSERGSGEHIKNLDIKIQIMKHLESYRGERANKFILYFQNFSNTYSTTDKLKKIYDNAFISDKIIGISIATRPDCINKEIAELIASYKDRLFVMVELGLQSVDCKVTKDLNLCYTTEDYITACKILNDYDIEFVTHMMIGLPNETIDSLDATIKIINDNGSRGIKIHNLYIVEGSKFHSLFEKGQLSVINLEEYLYKLEYVLTRLKPSIIVHRVSGDCPKDKLISPEWNMRKKLVLNGIDKLMKANDTYQGCYYRK